MKLKKYILDKKNIILFFIFIMSFISIVIYLDSNIKVHLNNIFYINLVSYFFFFSYIIIEYFYAKENYKIISSIIENQNEDIISSLPTPKSYHDSLYQELLKRLYYEQNNKIEKLYSEKKDNSDFVTTWVHEIKTPIAVSRLIIESNTEMSCGSTLDSLEEELDKIDNYVDQALYFSKSDDFSKDYFINEIDIDSVVKSLIKKHAKIFIGKRIKIDLQELNTNVVTDKKWLQFIIDQVLSNSLKYTKENGFIKIYLEKDEKEKRLIIQDNGIGIKPEDISRVFEKGFTGFNGRENQKATGMGLYLAKKLCIKLGHNLSIESNYGEYTRVTIYFPKLLDYYNVSKNN